MGSTVTERRGLRRSRAKPVDEKGQELGSHDLTDSLGSLVSEMEEVIEISRVFGQLASQIDEHDMFSKSDLTCHTILQFQQAPFEPTISPPVDFDLSEVVPVAGSTPSPNKAGCVSQTGSIPALRVTVAISTRRWV